MKKYLHRVYKWGIETTTRIDRLFPPPSFAELHLRSTLFRFRLERVWIATGVPHLRRKRTNVGEGVEEALKFVGHIHHEEDETEGFEVLALPYVLSRDYTLLEELLNVPLSRTRDEVGRAIRKTSALVTIGSGWAVPIGGLDTRSEIHKPTRSWKYLLRDFDHEKIRTKDHLAFWIALGFQYQEYQGFRKDLVTRHPSLAATI